MTVVCELRDMILKELYSVVFIIQYYPIYCVSGTTNVLPFNIEDAARSDVEIEKASKDGKQAVRVNQDTRLNNWFLELRVTATYETVRLVSHVLNSFRQFLLNDDFLKSSHQKINAGASEGGASVFDLDYKNKHACLAQSPQLHKQMVINGGFSGNFSGVFLVGPVFRAEDSYTQRHLCEFTGLDVEMEIKRHYVERCQQQLEAIGNQYPFKPLKYLRKTLRLTFEEGIQTF
ncbi:aspartate--tRNA ligase 1, cytoplasmic-like [Rutidosis leptorrhynchoides]|uniref:aspartate--tRNA ligase 1, cytoplasmic-like n=1 Tax=Rutidosis leptorrhynchoides TaxID=125765 RepID=UPI003A99D790